MNKILFTFYFLLSIVLGFQLGDGLRGYQTGYRWGFKQGYMAARYDGYLYRKIHPDMSLSQVGMPTYLADCLIKKRLTDFTFKLLDETYMAQIDNSLRQNAITEKPKKDNPPKLPAKVQLGI